MQKYVRECMAKPDIDLYSDNRILINFLYTPMTVKVHKRPKRKVKIKPIKVKSLQNTETKRAFVNAVGNYLQNYKVYFQNINKPHQNT